MKLRSTTSKVSTRSKLFIAAFSVLMVFAVPIQLSHNASADPYADKIKAIENEIKRYQDEASDLAKESRTLENELNKLTAEKSTIQAQVDKSQTEYDKLKADIKQTEKDIAQSQDTLGEILADIHVDDQVSPVELLFSSQTIGDFLDKQEYRSSIRDDLVSTIDEIKDLKTALEEQKVEVEAVLKDQKAQRDQLAAKENERSNLLSQTKGEEASFQSLISKRDAEIEQLREEQAAYFASLSASSSVQLVAGDPNKGGYPSHLANSNYYNPTVDNWGMYSRQCVSYTAWKVHQAYENMPYWGGIGNAWQWAYSGYHSGGNKVSYNSGNWHTANSQTYGVPSGSTPKKGSVAVRNANPSGGDPWGHTAWVEEVYGNGTIRISQYNWYNAGGSGWGHYSEMVVNSSFFGQYLYFGDK